MALVYSTEHGSNCVTCKKPLRKCQCNVNSKKRISSDGVVRISRETKGRKGKGVTVINGLPLTESELKKISKRFKQLCGTGGTVKEGIIEIQGDNREVLLKELKSMGYAVKLSGG